MNYGHQLNSSYFLVWKVTLGWINQNWAGRIQNTWAHVDTHEKNQRDKLCFACQSVSLELSGWMVMHHGVALFCWVFDWGVYHYHLCHKPNLYEHWNQHKPAGADLGNNGNVHHIQKFIFSLVLKGPCTSQIKVDVWCILTYWSLNGNWNFNWKSFWTQKLPRKFCFLTILKPKPQLQKPTLGKFRPFILKA